MASVPASPDGFRAVFRNEFTVDGFRAGDGAWLGGAIADRWNVVDIPQDVGQAAPKRAGGFDELRAEAPELEPQTVNVIKKCPACGKPNAATMLACNACSTPLEDVKETTSPNLFVGMIFGVAKAPFPLRISMRLETPSMMVFDDPLAITRAHVLAVPTDVYVPDIRSLFEHPAAGLDLVQRMEQAAWDALSKGHLINDLRRRELLSPEGAALDDQALRGMVIKGFNLPPSQYQLHLQYMLPPLLPGHFAIWQRGQHFVKMRHFPYEYIVAALQALVSHGTALPNGSQMDAQELVQEITALGVDYLTFYEEDMEKVGSSNAFLSKWQSDDFEYMVSGDVVVDMSGQTVQVASKEVESADKATLQNYGRPYGADGKPGGVYYKYARSPAALPGLPGAYGAGRAGQTEHHTIHSPAKVIQQPFAGSPQRFAGSPAVRVVHTPSRSPGMAQSPSVQRIQSSPNRVTVSHEIFAKLQRGGQLTQDEHQDIQRQASSMTIGGSVAGGSVAVAMAGSPAGVAAVAGSPASASKPKKDKKEASSKKKGSLKASQKKEKGCC